MLIPAKKHMAYWLVILLLEHGMNAQNDSKRSETRDVMPRPFGPRPRHWEFCSRWDQDETFVCLDGLETSRPRPHPCNNQLNNICYYWVRMRQRVAISQCYYNTVNSIVGVL